MCFFGRRKLLKKQEETAASLRDLSLLVENLSIENKNMKEVLTSAFQSGNTSLIQGIGQTLQFVTSNMTALKEQVAKDMKDIREDNEKRLNEIRGLVDEKLTRTLNERLTGTVTTINQRLDAVNKELGELQSLSGGVNDLKKVLTNVKTRGVWGEVSLAALLDGMLTKEQYVTQYNVTGRRRGDDSGLVDFAIVLPGKSGEERVYLPIDAKFPSEDYQRLVECTERGDKEGADLALKALIAAVKREARSIRDNYVEPPKTTDFALLYLPTEGLYAEVVRVPGLVEEMQNTLKVIPTGPTTVSGLINSLQLGFRTLAVQKSSREVFDLLTKFKQDFQTFVEQIGKVQGHIDGASRTLQDATKRTDIILKKLNKVEEIKFIGEDE